MVLKRGRKRETNIAILQSALRDLEPLSTPRELKNERNDNLNVNTTAKGFKMVEPVEHKKKKGIKKDAVINTKMLLT